MLQGILLDKILGQQVVKKRSQRRKTTSIGTITDVFFVGLKQVLSYMLYVDLVQVLISLLREEMKKSFHVCSVGCGGVVSQPALKEQVLPEVFKKLTMRKTLFHAASGEWMQKSSRLQEM